MGQTIYVTDGFPEYCWPITVTEDNGADISSDPIRVAFAGYSDPPAFDSPAWLTPVEVDSDAVNKRIVKVFVDAIPDPVRPGGRYWIWVRITDSPEKVPRRWRDSIRIV